MGLRLYCNYYGGRKQPMAPFKIEIFDNDGGGIGNAFECTREGARIKYEHNDAVEQLRPVVQDSSCQFTMYLIRNGNRNYGAESFFNDLTLGQEDRFTVKVTMAGQVRFIGNIIHDGLEEDDTFVSRKIISKKVTITASVGLTKFKTIKYLDIVHPINQWVTCTGALGVVFNKLDSKDYYGSNDGVFTASDMTEAQMTAGDPMSQMAINNQIFIFRKENELVSKSCHDVIRTVCEENNVRCIPIDGKIIFESLNLRSENSSFTRYAYTIGMSPNGSVSFDPTDKIVLDQTPVDFRYRDGKKLVKSPLRSTEVIYEHDTGGDFLLGVYWDFLGEVGQDYPNIGIAPVPDDVTRLKFLGTIEIIPTWEEGTDTNMYQIIFWFTIQIGDQYYVRDIYLDANPFLNQGYDPEEWSSTEGEYAWQFHRHLRQDQDDTRRLPLHFEILTKPIDQALDGDDVSVGLRYDLYDQDNNLVLEPPVIIQIQLYDGQILIVDEETAKVEKSEIRSYAEASTSNSLDYSLRILTSDGPNNSAKNRLRIDPPGAGDQLDASSWSTGRYGPMHHYDLLARELLHIRSVPRKILEGTVYTYKSLYNTLEYCGLNFIFLSGEFITGYLEVNGMWLEEKNVPTLSIPIENTINRKDTGGKPIPDIAPLIVIPPGTPQDDIITSPTNEIIPIVDMPDMSGLSDEELMLAMPLWLNGIKQRITSESTVDGYSWDNVNKKIITDQNMLPNDYYFIIWPVSQN